MQVKIYKRIDGICCQVCSRGCIRMPWEGRDKTMVEGCDLGLPAGNDRFCMFFVPHEGRIKSKKEIIAMASFIVEKWFVNASADVEHAHKGISCLVCERALYDECGWQGKTQSQVAGCRLGFPARNHGRCMKFVPGIHVKSKRDMCGMIEAQVQAVLKGPILGW